MDKLTEEQAGLLIKRFQAVLGDSYAPPFILQLEKIINQCTKKEFPEFERPIYNADDNLVAYLKLFKAEDYICVELNDKEHICLDVNDFTAFTKGCNKILGWLNEQSEVAEEI